MAKKTRSELKAIFQNDSTPDSTEFGHLIDSPLNLNDKGVQHIKGIITASGVSADSVSLDTSLTETPSPPNFTSSNEFGASGGSNFHTFFGPIQQSSSGVDSASYFLTPANFGTTTSPIKESGIFIKKLLNVNGPFNQLSQSISASLLISGTYGQLAFDQNEMYQWGDDFYIKSYAPFTEARGRTLFHSDHFHDRSSSVEIQTLRIQDQHGNSNKISNVGNVNIGKELLMNNAPLLNLTNNNTTRGPFNPIIATIQNSGKCLKLDIDFKETSNGVAIYDNSANDYHSNLSRIQWTAEEAKNFNSTWGLKAHDSVDVNGISYRPFNYKGWSSASIQDFIQSEKDGTTTNVISNDYSLGVPNSSGYVMKYVYTPIVDGIEGNNNRIKPNLGGFYQLYPNPQLGGSYNQMNHTYVQVFKALLPNTHEFTPHYNSQGLNHTEYWLTDNKGTGKWEWYARVNHVGDQHGVYNNSLSYRVQNGTVELGEMNNVRDSGYIAVRNITDEGNSGIQYENPVTFYLASCTVYDMTEADASIQRKVGINKIDPSHPLDVYLNDTIGPINSMDNSANIDLNGAPVRITNNTSSLYLDGNILYFSGSDSYINVSTDNNLDFSTNNSTKIKLTSNIYFNWNEGSNGIVLEASANTDVGTIRFDSDKLNFVTNGEERLTIQSQSSHVGINTTTPNSILEVVDSDPILTIRDTETDPTLATPTLRLAESVPSGDTTVLDNYWDLSVSESNFNIGKGDSNGKTNHFIVENDGNIVMGDPDFDTTQKLKVSGSITASAFEATTGILEGIFLDDNKKLMMGNNVGTPTISIFHSSSNDSYILNNDVNFTSGNGSNVSSMAFRTYYTQSIRFDIETTSYLTLNPSGKFAGNDGSITSSKNIKIDSDTGELHLGDSNDLTFTTSSINSTSNLHISSSTSIQFRSSTLPYQNVLISGSVNYIPKSNVTTNDTSLPKEDKKNFSAYHSKYLTNRNVVIDSNNVIHKTTERNHMPIDAIVMWNGTVSDIPDGWHLCDGSNGTFNITDSFVKGTTYNWSSNHTGDVHNIYNASKDTKAYLTTDNIPLFNISLPETTNLSGNIDNISLSFRDNGFPTSFSENGTSINVGINDRMWRTNGTATGTVPDSWVYSFWGGHNCRDSDNTGILNYNFNHGHTFTFGIMNLAGLTPDNPLNGIERQPPYYVLAYIQYKGA